MEDTKRTSGPWGVPFESPWANPFREFTTAWTRALELSFTAAANANRVALATLPDDVTETASESAGPPSRDLEDPIEPAPVESLAYARSDWEVERSVGARADLSVGDHVEFSKTVSDEDVRRFADASGDTNRLHLDESYAAGTRFGGRIVHGALVSGLVSAALAALPGTVIYLSQELSFLGPARVGDRLSATCRVVESLGDDRYRLSVAVVRPDGETVVDGDATILSDPAPDETDGSSTPSGAG